MVDSSHVVRPPFPEWAASEIHRLRQEADALERALNLYVGAPAGGVSANPRAARLMPSRGSKRPSKYEPALLAFEAEGRPLSYAEMAEIAARHGVPTEPSQLRSMVFVQKKMGRAMEINGSYQWGYLKQTKSVSVEEPNVDDLI